MKLNRTSSNWTSLERDKINENWGIIEGKIVKVEDGVANIIGEISDEAFNKIVDSAKLEWKTPVDSFADLPSGASEGDTRMARDSGKVYRYDGAEWNEIQEINPSPINEVDDRLTKQLAETDQKIGNVTSFREWQDNIIEKMKSEFDDRGYNIAWNALLVENGDWSPAIKKALDESPIEGRKLILPPGLIEIKQSLIFPTSENRVIPVMIEGSNGNQGSNSLIGNNRGITKINFTGEGALFDLSADEGFESRVTFRNFTAVCNSENKEGTYGVHADKFTGGALENVAFFGFENNLWFGEVYYSTFYKVSSRFALNYGLRVGLVNGTSFDKCSFTGNRVGGYLDHSGRSVNFNGCWFENNEVGLQSHRTRQVNLFGGYFELNSDASIRMDGSNNEEIPSVLNLYGTSISIDEGATAGIKASVSRKVAINLHGVIYANRSENANYLVASDGGTTIYNPMITSTITFCYDGAPLPLSPSSWDKIEIDGGNFRINEQSSMATSSHLTDTGEISNVHNRNVNASSKSRATGIMSQVNVSSDSAATQSRSQVNASVTSFANGQRSQVNSSDNSEASGTRSQVNASTNSQATGSTSQVNASSDSRATGTSSSVIGSNRVINNVNNSVAGGRHSSGNPSTANRKWHLYGETGDIEHSGVILSGHNFSDFAELFPNLTGVKQGNGLLQTLDGYGVRPAQEGESVLGVTSATAGIILGDTPFTWNDRWLRDEFGEYIYEEVWDEELEDYVKTLKENPLFNPEQEFLSRKERPDEWSVVGLVGQVYVRVTEEVKAMDYIKAHSNGVGTTSEESMNIQVMKITTPFDVNKGYAVAFCLLK